MAGKFKINGVDVAATYAMDFEDFSDAATPGAKIRYDEGKQEFQEKRITFRFHIAPADRSTTTMQGYLEGLAELVGVHCLKHKEVLLEQLYGESTSVAYAYICILESFEVEQASPAAFVHPVVYGRMTFIVVGQIDPLGVTTRTATLTGATDARNYYFEDANCAQGSSPLVITGQCSVGSSTFSVTALAIDDKLSYVHNYSKGGNVPVATGQYGYPAADFEASGAYLYYSSIQLLALSATNQATIVIRFKANYSPSDATDKYLISEAGAPFSIKIAATSQNIVMTFPGGTTTIAGSSISTSQWNTIVARLDPSIAGGAGLWLYVNGVEITSNGTTITSTGAANAGVIIGNSAATTNPCKCFISEVAIYKHPITYALIGALATLNRPIAESFIYDFNRNLTFLLDFSNGYVARANKAGKIILSNAMTSSEIVTVDLGRMSARKYNKTSGTYSDVTNELTPVTGSLDTITVQRYNKFAFDVYTSGTSTYTLTYQGKRRR